MSRRRLDGALQSMDMDMDWVTAEDACAAGACAAGVTEWIARHAPGATAIDPLRTSEPLVRFAAGLDGYGDGAGDGTGDGYGDWDRDGPHNGGGYGDGDGAGDGYGDGYGYGAAAGAGYGPGRGYGYGYVDGDGAGDGPGDGEGDGPGEGEGEGEGEGDVPAPAPGDGRHTLYPSVGPRPDPPNTGRGQAMTHLHLATTIAATVAEEEEEKARYVLVTTERGVFAGTFVSEREGGRTVTLNGARCAIYWGTTGGVFELAEVGPNAKSRVGGVAPRVTVFGVTSLADCTASAEAAWRAHGRG